MDRRTALKKIVACGTTPFIMNFDTTSQIHRRAVPSTGELLPVIGLGTWQTFDVGQDKDLEPLREVLKILTQGGASVVDTSPMYGEAESVVGKLTKQLSLEKSLFLATKVWTTGEVKGIKQIENSFSHLQRQQLDLLQIHNLVDWKTHYKTLQKQKEKGLIRYIGITHYTSAAYDQIEEIMKNVAIDFLQINFSIANRQAAQRLFPLAEEKRVAILINRPFEEGQLFQHVKGKSLPSWASDFDCDSWAQFFLKFILTQNAVTCILTGTSKPHHMQDNLKGGIGRIPTEKLQRQMIALINR